MINPESFAKNASWEGDHLPDRHRQYDAGRVRAVRRLVAAIRLAGAWRPKFSFRIAIHLLLAEIPIAERERGRTAGRPTAGSLFFEFTAANP
jgi:hypothetical protein